MKFRKEWKDKCYTMYKQGYSIKEITNFMWPKATRSQWKEYGVARKKSLENYLSYAVQVWGE
jgi:hypothetical protein